MSRGIKWTLLAVAALMVALAMAAVPRASDELYLLEDSEPYVAPDDYESDIIIAGMQFSADPAGPWTYIDLSEPLYIPVKTEVYFRAVLLSPGVELSWGGAASGAGETVSVKFGEPSRNRGDIRTVAVYAGDEKEVPAAEARVIVYEIRPSGPYIVAVGAEAEFHAEVYPDFVRGRGEWALPGSRLAMTGRSDWLHRHTATLRGSRPSGYLNDTSFTFRYSPESQGIDSETEFFMTMMGADRLQYRITGDQNWLELPQNGPIVVPVSASVDFKVINEPEIQCWPYGWPQWSYNTTRLYGEDGKDEITYVFNEISTAHNAPHTITADCGFTSVGADILVVGIEKIQYKIGGGEFKDAPTGQNALYVPVEEMVIFKAVPTLDVEFPENQPVWGGHASGSGETANVTFNSTSSHLNDKKTVIASWGASHAQVGVIVFEVIINNDQNGPPPQSVALGGAANLKANPYPDGLEGTFAWSQTGQKVVLYDSTLQTVNVEGSAVSDLLEDAVIEVEFTPQGAANAAKSTHYMTVVGVDHLEFIDWSYPNGGVALGPEDTVYLGLWNGADFRAVAKPEGAEWPDNAPEWGGIAEGNPPFEYTWVDADETGEYQISATAGTSSAEADVVVYEMVIRAADGVSDPPDYVLLEDTVDLKGVASPHAPVTHEWYTWSGRIELINDNQETVTVQGMEASGSLNDASIYLDAEPDGLGTPFWMWEPHLMTVIGLEKIQYRKDDHSPWEDTPEALYVSKDTELEFRAVIQPSAAQMPEGKAVWGGAAAGEDPGETASVTFDTASTHNEDFKSVTAECGNVLEAKVLVLEALDLVVTEALPGDPEGTYYTGREPGEYVYLTVEMNIDLEDPNDLPFGFLNWEGDGEQVNPLQRRISKNQNGVYETSVSLGEWNASATVKVLEIGFITVSGAIQGYMSMDNWYAPKVEVGDATVTVHVYPNVEEENLPEGLIEWSGNVTGEGKLSRKMSLQNVGVLNATVTLGSPPWSIMLYVFEITGLDVDGADEGTPEGTYYAAISDPYEYVSVVAEVSPEMDEWDFPGWDLLQWTGGDWGMGMFDRITPKWQSGSTTIRLQCGEFDEEVTIIVVELVELYIDSELPNDDFKQNIPLNASAAKGNPKYAQGRAKVEFEIVPALDNIHIGLTISNGYDDNPENRVVEWDGGMSSHSRMATETANDLIGLNPGTYEISAVISGGGVELLQTSREGKVFKFVPNITPSQPTYGISRGGPLNYSGDFWALTHLIILPNLKNSAFEGAGSNVDITVLKNQTEEFKQVLSIDTYPDNDEYFGTAKVEVTVLMGVHYELQVYGYGGSSVGFGIAAGYGPISAGLSYTANPGGATTGFGAAMQLHDSPPLFLNSCVTESTGEHTSGWRQDLKEGVYPLQIIYPGTLSFELNTGNGVDIYSSVRLGAKYVLPEPHKHAAVGEITEIDGPKAFLLSVYPQ